MGYKKYMKVLLGMMIGTLSYGASIDHIQNYTPEYNANPAQQGAINPGTSSYYNPAGLMQLENGRYFSVGIQYAIGTEEMRYEGETYDASLSDPIPNFTYIDKNDKRAWYITAGGLAGGGSLKYDDGVAGIALLEDLIPNLSGGALGAVVEDQYAKGSNRYIQGTVGRAWFLTDKLSVSAAGRFVYGIRELEGDASGYIYGNTPSGKVPVADVDVEIDSEREAYGFGGVFGLNYKATDKLNIGMRYDTRVKMEFEADASEDLATIPGLGSLGFSTFYPQYADGEEERRDLPAILALGASYKVKDNWTLYTGGNYYFNKDAKIDDDNNHGEYDNGWEISLGSEYWINDKWALLFGANYADTGAEDDTFSDIEYAVNSFMLGSGVKYRPNENNEFVFSLNHYWYDSEDGKHYSEEYSLSDARYNKSIYALGLSYTRKF